MTSFADITTMGVGGPIAHFIEPTTRVGLIEAVEEADSKGLPLVVVGGGSNLLVSDKPFDGVVVRDARRLITVPDEAAPVEGEDRTVHVNAEAGANWDDFVAFTVELGLEGVEGLSGIPGTVGGGVLMLCLAEKLAAAEVEAVAAGIIAWHKELAPAGDSTVVFRDSAFDGDVAKTNMAAILAQNGLENVRSV